MTSTIFVGEKTPEVWPAVIRKTGATIFAAVPGLMRQILKYAPPGPLDLGKLRHGLIAGEAPARRCSKIGTRARERNCTKRWA